nr:hypothetical protein [Chloroflexota bacterium]
MGAVATLLAATFALGPLFLYPGLGWAALLLGGDGGPLVRLAQAVGMTLLIVPAVCVLLATVGLLHPVAVLASLGIVSVVPLAFPTTRERLAGDLRWLARPRTLLAAGIGAVVVGAIVIWPSHAQVGPGLLPHNSTVWYYANLAQLTAESWRFPGLMVEWGEQRPFHTDYLPVTAHTAAAFQLLPRDLPLSLELYRLAVLAAGAALAALLFRRWLPAWTAVLAACLLLATTRLDVKFLSYKPETFGLVIGLFVLWLADRTLAERSLRLGLLSVAGAALVFLSHAEVFLVLGPALLGLAGGHALFGEPLAEHVAGGGPRYVLRRRLPAVAIAAGLAAVVFLGGIAAGTAASLAVTGSGRILGYATSPTTRIDPLQPERIPVGWRLTEDPTWDFVIAATRAERAGAPPPGRRSPLGRFQQVAPD